MIEFATVLVIEQRQENDSSLCFPSTFFVKSVATTSNDPNIVDVVSESMGRDQKDFHGDCEKEGTGRENPKKAKACQASFLTKKIDRTSIVLFGVLYIIFNCIYFMY